MATPRKKNSLLHYDELPCVDSLRILSLKPGQSAEPLDISLETIDGGDVLSRLATVEALSYVWDSRDRTQRITCNKMSFDISTNLAAALQVVRLSDARRSLWVDAICI